MKKNYILFIDSGVGGLSTLSVCLKNLKANYIYYADNLHSPYGNLDSEQIFENIKGIIELIIQKYYITTIVLACNTATTSSIEKLRNHFKCINFIGTEPAIKLAQTKNYKKIVCIATPTTTKQDKFKCLCLNAFVPIKCFSFPNLAQNIENYLTNYSIKNFFLILKDIYKIKAYTNKSDCLILGCTHYVLIEKLIKKYINIPILDGNYGVCKRLTNFEKAHKKSTLKVFLSKNTNELKQKYIKILKQTLAKE